MKVLSHGLFNEGSGVIEIFVGTTRPYHVVETYDLRGIKNHLDEIKEALVFEEF